MTIENQTYEEALYRADVLGEAVAFIEWHRNATAVKTFEENVFDAAERKIHEVQKLGSLELFRNGA